MRNLWTSEMQIIFQQTVQRFQDAFFFFLIGASFGCHKGERGLTSQEGFSPYICATREDKPHRAAESGCPSAGCRGPAALALPDTEQFPHHSPGQQHAAEAGRENPAVVCPSKPTGSWRSRGGCEHRAGIYICVGETG